MPASPSYEPGTTTRAPTFGSSVMRRSVRTETRGSAPGPPAPADATGAGTAGSAADGAPTATRRQQRRHGERQHAAHPAHVGIPLAAPRVTGGI
jgi:type IV secretory pathway TrbL component